METEVYCTCKVLTVYKPWVINLVMGVLRPVTYVVLFWGQSRAFVCSQSSFLSCAVLIGADY